LGHPASRRDSFPHPLLPPLSSSLPLSLSFSTSLLLAPSFPPANLSPAAAPSRRRGVVQLWRRRRHRDWTRLLGLAGPGTVDHCPHVIHAVIQCDTLPACA
jgi:hypothetical protein